MYGQLTTAARPLPPAVTWPVAASDMAPDETGAALYRERTWRQPSPFEAQVLPRLDYLASRWIDQRTSVRREQADATSDRCVIGVALRPARLRLTRGAHAVFDGMMPAGMVHASTPGQSMEVEFLSPCDFIHLHVANDELRDRIAATCVGARDKGCGDSDLLVHDALAGQLVRTLMDETNAGNPLYVESIGRAIVTRLLAGRPPAPRISALPKWRLKRVRDYIAENVGEPVTLADLARAAGLSRMHFAAQFRAATGCRPHDYLLQYRIESAKQALSGSDRPLVDVALSVGFQTQSHFSTVFKKLTGETPGRWQRANRSFANHSFADHERRFA